MRASPFPRLARLLATALAAALVMAAPARAEQATVVVLPLESSGSRLDDVALAALEEEVRTIAGNALRPLGFTVLTGDTALGLLKDRGIQARGVVDASSSIEAARLLRTQAFVTGTATTTEGLHLVFVRLFDTASGRQLGSVHVEGETGRDLRQRLAQGAAGLFAELQPKDAGAAANQQRVDVRFESVPAGAVVLVDGELACPATPCLHSVPRGSREVTMRLERYEEARERRLLDTAGVVSLALAPAFGLLTVATEPARLGVRVDGRYAGTSPRERVELAAGAHLVAVDDPCWEAAEQQVRVEAGRPASVLLAPGPRKAGLRVAASDAEGRPLSARVLVDGVELGRTPGTFQAPACAKEVTVVTDDGEKWSSQLALVDKDLLQVTAQLQSARRFAVRAGLGGLTGVLGVGAEFRLGRVGLALGTGTHLLTGGVSLGLRERGGPYLDLHAAWVRAGLLGRTLRPGVGVGATVGYDFRPVPWWSVKVGVGAGYNTANDGALRPLLVDAATGVVF